jgi:hypothetical protein
MKKAAIGTAATRNLRGEVIPEKERSRTVARIAKTPIATGILQCPTGGFSVIGMNTTDRAVVVTLTVAVAGAVAPNVTEAGEIVQVASVGAPLQVNATLPLNPAPPVNDRG